MAHMPACTIDTLSGYRLPASASDWTALLAGTAFSNPQSSWAFQDASGAIADQVGAAPLTASGTSTYRQALAGWSSYVVKPDGTTYFGPDAGGANVNTTSQIMLLIMQLGANPVGTRDLIEMGLQSDPNKVSVNSTGFLIANNKSNTATGLVAVSTTAPTVIAMKIDKSIQKMVVYNNGSETIKPTWANPLSSQNLYVGAGGNNWPTPSAILYAALWTGVAAERSDADVAALITRIKTGRS